MKLILGRWHVFYVHGDVGEGRSINIYYPPIHWPVKSFTTFKGLTDITANYVHCLHDKLNWGNKIFVVG